MSSFFDNLAVFEHHNFAGISDGRKSMSDNNNRLITCRLQLVKSLLHLVLALSIKRAGSLIKQQHFRLPNQSSRDRDPLLLTARKPDAALANLGIEPFWKQLFVKYEGENVCLRACKHKSLLDLLVGDSFKVDSVEDVLSD